MNTSVPIQKIKLLNPYSREFDLDETVAKARQKARAKHFQTFTVPAHRLVGPVSYTHLTLPTILRV